MVITFKQLADHEAEFSHCGAETPVLVFERIHTGATMLQHLSIRDFAIVPRQDLDLEAGFTVITGETGAGKSLIVDALSLLSGRRADTDLIREGADKAELSGEFILGEQHPAAEWLREAEMDDEQSCLLRRVISSSGRSRAWINGTPVTLNQLQELGALLVEIHGQNEHIRLSQPEERFHLLDHGGGYDDALGAVSAAYARWHACDAELERLRGASALDAGELELLQHQLKELEQVALPAEAVHALETEQKRLAGGSELMSALEFAGRALSDSSDDDVPAIAEQLYRVVATLEPLEETDPRIGEALAMVRESAINCEEARKVVERVGSDIDLSPERLRDVESQLGALYDLSRKHRCAIDELETARDALADRIEQSSSLESRIARLEKDLAQALADYTEAESSLHKARAKRAAALGKAVTQQMQGLAMEGGQFRIDLEPLADTRPTPRGRVRIALLVSANAGVSPGPLRKVASGGELSRISLAIKVANRELREQAGRNDPPVQIFDEVDAGVGGDTANAVGSLLRAIAGDAQTLCVTHLAQVAARAHHQVKIEKSTEGKQLSVSATVLENVAREEEIARMLSGKVSDSSLAHARELIKDSAA